MVRVRVLLGVSVALLFAVSADAANEWTFGSSDHFEVFTTGGPGKARDALNYFERIHAFFTDVLHVDSQTTAPTRLIVFSNDKEYTPYRPNEGAAAYYQPGPDRDYIVMRSLNADAYPIVVHEYMHLVVRHLNAGTLPLWMNEGWADFYSTLEPRGPSMAIGGVAPGRMQALAMTGKLMPFDRLFAVAHDSPEYNDKNQMGLFYSQSWALMHMLLAGNSYYQQSPKFLELMLAGTDSATAIATAYGRPLPEVAKDLGTYIHTGQFQLRLFAYKIPKARKDLDVRDATAFEARLVIANLQAVSVRGEADARAAFAQLEQENDAHLELQESIATFEYRRGHPEAAEPHFARAVALGSTNWQIYRDYAYGTEGQERRLELFGKAVTLNPADLDLRLRYADALLRADRQVQALAVLGLVTHVDREHAFVFFQLAAQANAANDRMDDARKAAERATGYASTQSEKDFASRLVARLSSRPVAPVPGGPAADAPARPDAASTGLQAEPKDIAIVDGVIKMAPERMLNGSEVVADATFQLLDCGGPEPVMQFRTDAGVIRLSMNSPDTIMLKGAGAETVNLNCGDQRNRPVRVGYTREATAESKTTGDVRYLEFK